MWVSELRLDVRTAGDRHAGTDDRVTVWARRDGQELFGMRLDFPGLDDLERGSSRSYVFRINRHFFDQTEPLPDGIGQWPPPYPTSGLELSGGVSGHLVLRLRPSGDDAWKKAHIKVWIRKWKTEPDGFDAWTWVEESTWTDIGDFPADVWISTDGSEGHTRWDLRL